MKVHHNTQLLMRENGVYEEEGKIEIPNLDCLAKFAFLLDRVEAWRQYWDRLEPDGDIVLVDGFTVIWFKSGDPGIIKTAFAEFHKLMLAYLYRNEKGETQSKTDGDDNITP